MLDGFRYHSALRCVVAVIALLWLLATLVSSAIAADSASSRGEIDLASVSLSRLARTAIFGSTQPASSASVLDTVERATRVAAYGGWIAWSSYNPAHNGWELVTRNPQGITSVQGVPERAGMFGGFDVGLGPTAAGGVAAVYSRCTGSTQDSGCSLWELELGVANTTERRLAAPCAGSLYEPVLWNNAIVFLRADHHGGSWRENELFEWKFGSSRAQPLSLPHNAYSASELKRHPSLLATDGAFGRITGLSFNGTRVAYTRAAIVLPPSNSTTYDVWVQRLGRSPQLLARVNSDSPVGVPPQSYLSPTLSGPWLYVYRQLANLGDTWVRFSLASDTTQRAEVDFGDTSSKDFVQAVAPSGSGVVWSLLEPSFPNVSAQILLLPDVTWKNIARPRPPATQP